MVYYITTLLVYAGVDAIACLGLSQQFGIAGVTNFGFIIFQAAGAYAAAVLSLPADSANGGFQTYIGGLHLPFPLPWIGAAIVGGLLAVPFTLLVGRRLRGDFAAVGLLVTAVMFNLLVTNYEPLVNGAAGLSLVPAPLQGSHSTPCRRATSGGTALSRCSSPSRPMSSSPDSPTRPTAGHSARCVTTMWSPTLWARTSARCGRPSLVVGGAIAGLSGAILVGFINLWDPQAWGYAETVVLFAAVIIGGLGNHRGAILGAILVPVAFEEATRYIPPVPGNPNLIPALQWVVIGLLILLFLWFRPQGILPERRRKILGHRADAVKPAVSNGSPAWPAVASAAPGQLEADPIILRCEGLVRSFEGVHAVDDVTMSFRRGRLTGIIGPNGAGKSTVLAMLAGTLEPTAGTIYFRGRDVTRLPAYRRAAAGAGENVPAGQRIQAPHRAREPADRDPRPEGRELPRGGARQALLGHAGA